MITEVIGASLYSPFQNPFDLLTHLIKLINMMTLKSICTSYELASMKNFTDNLKRVVMKVYKQDEFTYITCSEQLSAELRACKDAKELTELLTTMSEFKITNQIIAGE